MSGWINMSSLVEITPTYVIYHTDRNYYCVEFTLGMMHEGKLFQTENTEYGLAVL